MQFKKLMSYCAIMLLPLSLQANCCEEACCPQFEDSCNQCQDASSWDSLFTSCSSDWSAEFRLAYYRPVEKDVRRIYSDSFLDYQVELNKRVLDTWQVWLGFDTIGCRKGHSILEEADSYGSFHRTGRGDKTTLKTYSFNLGLKYLYSISECTELYFGAGINYGILSVKDYSSYVHKRSNKEDVGGLFKVGVYTYLTENIYLDFFFDYLVQEFRFKNHHGSGSYSYTERHNVHLSGIKTGVGIGYRF